MFYSWLVFQWGGEAAIQMSLKIFFFFCLFLIPGLCYVNLNNLSFIFNLSKSLGEMCYSFARRHNSCADTTNTKATLHSTKAVILLHSAFFFLFFWSKLLDFIVCREVVSKVHFVQHSSIMMFCPAPAPTTKSLGNKY